MPVDCVLVTCEMVPALDPDDRLFARALRARGLTVATAVWSDPRVDWAAGRLTLLRSTWDYHRRFVEFIAWIGRVASRTVLRNEPHLLRWNAHKSYLRELERLGVPVVPTIWLQRGERHELSALRAAHGRRDLVLKPARGLAGHDVTLVRGDAASQAGQARLDRLLRNEDVLVQPYLEAVADYGERGLIFFRGCYSHAVVKKPFDRILIVGDEPSLVVEATADEIRVASQAIAALPGAPLYARVDLLNGDEGHPRVNEVELIEPGLYLAVHTPARRAFADAVERELELVSNPRYSEGVAVVSSDESAL